MIRYNLLMILSCFLIGCVDHHSDAWFLMEEAESMIEEYPDSALRLLSTIKDDELMSSEERARQALLLSKAYDKCYIDTATFDILQPAIDFYLKNGNADEKLNTYYYQGRVYQNAGDTDNAVKSFMNAVDLSKYITDTLTFARTLVAQACIYHSLLDFDDEYKNYLSSAAMYNVLNNKECETECLIRGLNASILLQDRSKSDSVRNQLCDFEFFNEYQKNKLFMSDLMYSITFGSKEDIKRTLDKLHNIDLSDNEINLNLAYAYSEIGENEKSRQLLSVIKDNDMQYDTLKYLSISVDVLKKTGDFEGALSSYWQFNHKNDSINMLIFDRKSKSVEDYYRMELETQRNSSQKMKVIWTCVFVIVVLIFLILILFLIAHRNRVKRNLAIQREKTKIAENAKLSAEKENLILENKYLSLEKDMRVLESENLSHRIDELEYERERLNNLLHNSNDIPNEAASAIKIRLEMLNSFLASYIADNEKYKIPFEEWIKNETENANKFMDSNRLAFVASHPKFIKFLEESKLNIDEINYVCLYALGLRGKEIGNYMKKKSHVNLSSVIRKKLDLERNDTNLGIYIRKLLKEL